MSIQFGMSKAAMARHLTQPHGGARSLLPLQNLRTWSRSELECEHARLCRLGPCPRLPGLAPLGFRDRMEYKAAGQ